MWRKNGMLPPYTFYMQKYNTYFKLTNLICFICKGKGINLRFL